jgi:DNA-binding XRE family transcriptional regulator
MNHRAADLIEQLRGILLAFRADYAALADSTGIPGPTIAHIFRLDYDPPIDEVMALARCAGRTVTIAPESTVIPDAPSSFRPRGAESFAAQDLLRLRDVFRGYRRTIGVSPTRLARLCAVNEKAFRRTESGTRSPSLGLAFDCAEPLGLSIVLIPETRLSFVAAATESDRKRRAPRLALELERSLPPPEALPEVVRPLATMLTDIADHHDLGVRQIAAATGIELSTLTGGRRPCGSRAHGLNAIGSVPTTVRVAAFLGCDLIIVPSDGVDEVAELSSSIPSQPLDHRVEEQLAAMRTTIARAGSDLARAGGAASDVGEIERIGNTLHRAHTARLATRLDELGFTLMAVPSDVSSRARRLAGRTRLSPRKDTRKEDRETTAARNKRLTERFIVRLERACRHRRRIASELPQTRTSLQIVLERLREAELSLDVIDVDTRETVLRYCGRDAGEFVSHIIDLRVKRGFSLHSLGAGVHLTHSAVRRAEKPDARRRALLSSVLRYAETIGLDLVPSKP